MRILLVTDPMCSWCWGMTADVETAMAALADTVEFDLVLGGINTHGTQPIGDYGRRYMRRLWADVAATTGQSFADKLPDDYVHNSTPACLAVETVRQLTGAPPIAYLHALQRAFFLDSVDITNTATLILLAEPWVGGDSSHFEATMLAPATRERVRFQFDVAKSFGTNALPSLLVEENGATRLLAGGYVNAEMMQALIEQALERAD